MALNFKAFRDAARVAADVAEVAERFAAVPDGLHTVAKEIYAAALHRDAAHLAAALDAFGAVVAAAGDDRAAAQPAIDALGADVKQLLADIGA